MSLISRLRAVVAGDDFLDSDFDELDYETSEDFENFNRGCLLYTSPSPRDRTRSRMPSSA